MIEKLNTTKSVLLLLVILFVLMFCISFFSEGTFDPGDGVRHYLISRYSWQHHYLFLDSWGKTLTYFLMQEKLYLKAAIRLIFIFGIWEKTNFMWTIWS